VRKSGKPDLRGPFRTGFSLKCFSESISSALPAADGPHKVQQLRRSRGGVMSWMAGSR
jgi:hypothetical protein